MAAPSCSYFAGNKGLRLTGITEFGISLSLFREKKPRILSVYPFLFEPLLLLLIPRIINKKYINSKYFALTDNALNLNTVFPPHPPLVPSF